jgi:hypothetical protein
LIKLAKANSGADSLDIGFYGLYDTSGSQDLYAGLFRDANDSGKFKLFKDLQVEPTTTVNTSGTGYAVGTLVSNLEGNVTGNITGTVSSISNHSTSDLSEGTNLYYTDTRFDTRLAAKTTDNLSEGSSNLYMTTERVQDIVGGMVTGNTETGITVTYEDSDGTLDFVVGTLNQDTTGNAATATALETARAIALSGDVVGTANFDGTAGISISTTIQANSVALGTDTVGDYVSTITAGTGLTSTGATSGEGIAHSLSVDAAQTQITSVGALDGGSITSGFGSIDVGSSAITTSGTVTGGTLAGTLSTAAQTNITSVGTLTGFTSTGIDDNADATAITIDSSENVAIGVTSAYTGGKLSLNGGLVQSSGNQHVLGVFGTSGLQLIGTTGGDNIVGTMGSSEPLIFRTASAERMRIDSSGNVGIGETSPSGQLHIKGTDVSASPVSSANQLVLEDTENGISILSSTAGAGNIAFGDSGDNFKGGFVYDHSADAMRFITNGAETMRIDSSGQLFLGKTSGVSGAFFQVAGDASNQSIRMENAYGTGTAQLITNTSGQTFNAILFENSGVSGSISVTTSSTAYNTSSDARLKNVLGEAKGLEIINKLNPVNFEWKESKEIQDGLIAQEVMEIVPNAVSGSEEDYYQMDYSKLVTPLIKAIQEQQEQIDALQSEINLLKGE